MQVPVAQHMMDREVLPTRVLVGRVTPDPVGRDMTAPVVHRMRGREVQLIPRPAVPLMMDREVLLIQGPGDAVMLVRVVHVIQVPEAPGKTAHRFAGRVGLGRGQGTIRNLWIRGRCF